MFLIQDEIAQANLKQELTLSVIRFQEHFGKLTREITNLKDRQIPDIEAKALLHDVFTQGIMPLRFVPDVSKAYFEPQLKDFERMCCNYGF